MIIMTVISGFVNKNVISQLNEYNMGVIILKTRKSEMK